ncbi:MAG: response regulator transcription factor [Butyrivibrio sp.]|nr:response regulator transcription factor [Butyrivibrio sp.]
MKIAVCDDEKRICGILAEKASEILPDAAIAAYPSGEALLGDAEFPDILLLDIKMPGLNGMEAAKTLRDRGWQGILVFITGEADRVFDSFDLHAFHFLVKPVKDEKLRATLLDARAELERRQQGRFVTEEPSLCHESADHGRYIHVQSGASHIRVPLSRLMYAEVYDRKTVLHTKKDEIEYYGQLSALEKVVGKDFYRIHRSYLVHLKYVERYDKSSVTLINDVQLPIARRSFDGFLKAYMEYGRREVRS